MKSIRTNILGCMFITTLAPGLCSGDELLYKMKFIGPTVTTTNGPGNSIVATEHTYNLAGNNGTLTITCKKSDTNRCHYLLWQVTSKDAGSTETKIFERAWAFVLAAGETKVVKPALEGSSYCHASDKLPDSIACTRTKIRIL